MRSTLLLAAALTLAVSACASTAPSADGRSGATASAASAAALDAAIAGSWRTPAYVARDGFRHPKQTLAFFGVEPDDTVVEITPGGGWYTEILAPYLRDGGRYVAAIVDPMAYDAGRQRDYYAKARADFEAKLAGAPAQFDRTAIVAYNPKAPVFGTPASADVVLTFRNVHNWVGAGSEAAMFKGFYDVLAPGGVLGVVEHRAAAGKTLEEVVESGYLPEDYVVGLATAAGFVLEEKSEINANPADTKDHPNGVWTLPPGNRHDEADKAKYAAIGESDRMTLRFVKPQAEAAPAE